MIGGGVKQGGGMELGSEAGGRGGAGKGRMGLMIGGGNVAGAGIDERWRSEAGRGLEVEKAGWNDVMWRSEGLDVAKAG
jgi:hypothetical protein